MEELSLRHVRGRTGGELNCPSQPPFRRFPIAGRYPCEAHNMNERVEVLPQEVEEEVALCPDCGDWTVLEDGVCPMCGEEYIHREHDDGDMER